MIRDFAAGLLANPGRALLATLLLLCIIMVFPVIAALRRKAREHDGEREHELRRSPEPRFRPAPYPDEDDEVGDIDDDDEDAHYRRGGFGSGPPRRRRKSLPVGTLSKVAWFGLGVAVGAGLMAMNGAMLGIGDYLRMPVGAGPQESPESASSTAQAPAASEDAVRIAEEALANLPPDMPQPAARPVEAQLAEFVAGMKAQLPMPIGREINLVKVDAGDGLVTLGFAIQRTIPESDYPALQKTLEERFRSGVCNGKDELRIRALNQAGVSFSVLYSDLVGKTVARLEVPPNFCRASG